jgi:hypothetical protein
MLNHPASSREPEPSKFAHAGPPKPSPCPPALSHRQAREQLALLLDETTELPVRAALQRHVARCAGCQQELEELRQAEAWFQAQPLEAPEMVALEGATWAAIQERLAPKPEREWAALQAMLSQRELLSAGEVRPAERVLLPAGANGGEQEPSPRLHLLPPVPTPPGAAPQSPPSSSRSWFFRPHKVLVAVLAASFLMTSMAALFLAHLANIPAVPATTSNQSSLLTDILDPGNLTSALAFDPLSHRLFTLSSDKRADCPRGMPCPGIRPCMAASSLDVETGKRSAALVPACMGRDGDDADSFTDLLDDAALGQVVAVSNAQQVMTYNSRASAPGASYRLACCTDQNAAVVKTFIDQRDHLLLSAGVSLSVQPDWKSLAAQDTRTGKVAYQTTLPTEAVQGGQSEWALFSETTDWLYLWANCATIASGLCIEVYEAKNGSKVATWEAQPDETPLAADPAQEILYVRQDTDSGQSKTLALDARSGEVRGQLPPAWALAVNSKLHHAYLLSKAGVTVADTQSWQVLSTLPVLAHDLAWTAPAVDEQQDRVYVPTILGKVLKVQDTPAGRLSLRSPEDQAVLNADRVMENSMEQGKNALDPWQLPLGPGATSLYYTVWQATGDGAAAYGVPARLETSVAPLEGGSYSVLIALSWSHTSALGSFASTPPLLPSYPYKHTWRYQVPSSGDALLSEEHGDPLARCC